MRASLLEGIDAALAACSADLRHAVLAEAARRQAELDHAAAATTSLQQTLAETRLQLEGSRQTEDELRRRSDEIAHTCEERRVEVVDLQERLGAALHAEELARRALDVAGQRSDALERESADQRSRIDDLERSLVAAGRSLQRADRLHAALQAIDGARSFAGVLDEVARRAREEADRAAVFLVSGAHVRGWRSLGFDPAVDTVVRSELRPEEAGLIAEAARLGEGREHLAGEGGPLPSFAGGNGCERALAVPLEVDGTVIAVLYADWGRADDAAETRWPDAIQMMARHAGRALEAMTVRRAADLLAARDVARWRGPLRSPAAGAA